MEELEEYTKKLEKDEEYQCIRISKPYKDRGENGTYRLYVEVKRKKKSNEENKIAGVDVNFLLREAQKFANAKTPRGSFPSYTRKWSGSWKSKE